MASPKMLTPKQRRLAEIEAFFSEVGGDLAKKKRNVSDMLGSFDLLANMTPDDDLMDKLKRPTRCGGFTTVIARAAIREPDSSLRAGLRKVTKKILDCNPEGHFNPVLHVALDHMVSPEYQEPVKDSFRIAAQEMISLLLRMDPKHCAFTKTSHFKNAYVNGTFDEKDTIEVEKHPTVLSFMVHNFMSWQYAKPKERVERTEPVYRQFLNRFQNNPLFVNFFFTHYMPHMSAQPALCTDDMAKSIIDLHKKHNEDQSVKTTLTVAANYMLSHVSQEIAERLKQNVQGPML